MPPFCRRVVASLLRTVEPAQRPRARAYVDGALASMPEHLRFGVAAESVLLGCAVRLRHPTGMADEDLRSLVATWEQSPVGPVRQYARLLTSLVVFAEHELGADPTAAPCRR